VAERGGATTQEGIFYQNTVAAWYLADLLELTQLPPRERVLEVRVEAPSCAAKLHQRLFQASPEV